MIQQAIHQRITCRAALVFALAIVLGSSFSTNTVDASILLPDIGLQADSSLDAERLISEMEEQEDAPSGTSSGTPSPRSDSDLADEKLPTQEEQYARQFAAMASQTDGSTSGTSSSSSGSSSTSGGASLLASAATIMPDNSLVERYATELALAIPDAPGNELLRPPQG